MEQKLINNRYVIIKQIGYTGFSSVFKAWDNILERFVAVKKVSDDVTTDAKLFSMFKEEALNCAKLQHENIVQIFDLINTEDNSNYVVMEFVDGRDLNTILKRSMERNKPLPIEICSKIVRDVAIALDYAYQKKDDFSKNSLRIIHQDITPNNILIYFDGRIKLTDFGISRVVKKVGSKDSNTFILQGKYHYMSPEQAVGSPYVTQKSDMYSLGIVFIELLTSQKVFEGTEFEIVEKVKESDFNRGLLGSIREPIKSLLTKMLQKDPENRPQTMEEVISVLSQFIRERKFGQKRRDLAKFLYELFGAEIDEFSKEQLVPLRTTGFIKPEELGAERGPVTIRPGFQEKYEIKLKPQVSTPKEKLVERTVHPVQSRVAETKIPSTFKFPKFVFVLIPVLAILFEIFVDVPKKISPIGKYFGHSASQKLSISIDSIPSNAEISLTNSKGEDIAKQTNSRATPFKLSDVKEGIYNLTLKKGGYADITRQLDLGKKGALSFIKSQNANNFIIQFDTKLEIKSVPADLYIFIDGKQLPQKTPATIMISVGKHAIKLENAEKDGIGSTSIDKSNNAGRCIADFIDDKHDMDSETWKLDYSYDVNNVKLYQLKGSLLKSVRIDSSPSEADVYLDGNLNTSLGKTPLNIKISSGKHKILIKKKGFTKEANPELRVPILLKYEGEVSVKSAAFQKGDNQFSWTLKE